MSSAPNGSRTLAISELAPALAARLDAVANDPVYTPPPLRRAREAFAAALAGVAALAFGIAFAAAARSAPFTEVPRLAALAAGAMLVGLYLGHTRHRAVVDRRTGRLVLGEMSLLVRCGARVAVIPAEELELDDVGIGWRGAPIDVGVHSSAWLERLNAVAAAARAADAKSRRDEWRRALELGRPEVGPDTAQRATRDAWLGAVLGLALGLGLEGATVLLARTAPAGTSFADIAAGTEEAAASWSAGVKSAAAAIDARRRAALEAALGGDLSAVRALLVDLAHGKSVPSGAEKTLARARARHAELAGAAVRAAKTTDELAPIFDDLRGLVRNDELAAETAARFRTLLGAALEVAKTRAEALAVFDATTRALDRDAGDVLLRAAAERYAKLARADFDAVKTRADVGTLIAEQSGALGDFLPDAWKTRVIAKYAELVTAAVGAATARAELEGLMQDPFAGVLDESARARVVARYLALGEAELARLTEPGDIHALAKDAARLGVDDLVTRARTALDERCGIPSALGLLGPAHAAAARRMCLSKQDVLFYRVDVRGDTLRDERGGQAAGMFANELTTALGRTITARQVAAQAFVTIRITDREPRTPTGQDEWQNPCTVTYTASDDPTLVSQLEGVCTTSKVPGFRR